MRKLVAVFMLLFAFQYGGNVWAWGGPGNGYDDDAVAVGDHAWDSGDDNESESGNDDEGNDSGDD